MKVILAALLLGAGTCSAAPDIRRDDQEFLDGLRKLIEKQYPKAEVSSKNGELHFTFNVRKFMIHEPWKDGEWQEATEQIGPRKGGICGDLRIEVGPYEGQAAVPQEIDKRYFVLWLAAPYSVKANRHLRVDLKYPRDVSKEFLKEFVEHVAKFEKSGR